MNRPYFQFVWLYWSAFSTLLYRASFIFLIFSWLFIFYVLRLRGPNVQADFLAGRLSCNIHPIYEDAALKFMAASVLISLVLLISAAVRLLKEKWRALFYLAHTFICAFTLFAIGFTGYGCDPILVPFDLRLFFWWTNLLTVSFF